MFIGFEKFLLDYVKYVLPGGFFGI